MVNNGDAYIYMDSHQAVPRTTDERESVREADWRQNGSAMCKKSPNHNYEVFGVEIRNVWSNTEGMDLVIVECSQSIGVCIATDVVIITAA